MSKDGRGRPRILFPNAESAGKILDVDQIRNALLESMHPELTALAQRIYDASYDAVRRFYTQKDRTPAMAQIFNQTINDFHELLGNCLDGRGRSAARTARSLYEHLINFHDVVESIDNANRYVAHRSVTDLLYVNMRPGLDLLSGEIRRKEERRLNNLKRKATRETAAAIKKYGAGFRRGWHEDSLRTRATAAGMEKHYDAYRLLSAVLHGSSGGQMSTRAMIGGTPVHRTGPDIALCSLALLEGAVYVREFLQLVEGALVGVDLSELVESVHDLLDAWPKFREIYLVLDKATWPDSSNLLFSHAVLAMYTSEHRWFCLNLESGKIALANPPANEGQLLAQLEAKIGGHIDRYRSSGPHDKPFTIGLTTIQVVPKSPTRWQLASSILGDGRDATPFELDLPDP